jgi:hypothetical protein
MQTDLIDGNKIMRRTLMTVFLVVYYLSWFGPFIVFHRPEDLDHGDFCGAATVGALILPSSLLVTSLIINLLLYSESKTLARKDYRTCLLLTCIPIPIVIIDFFT